MALPDGFQWRPYLDGWALYFGDRQVADACEASPGNGWRMSLNGSEGPPRYVFLRDKAACVRYAEAWAIRWQDRIRSHGMEPPPLNAGSGPQRDRTALNRPACVIPAPPEK